MDLVVKIICKNKDFIMQNPIHRGFIVT